ncbi:MAG: hypothetical protein ACFE0J_23140 [Elainellaceae cyanobacterium]
MGDDVEWGAMTGMGFLENITNGDRPIRLVATHLQSELQQHLPYLTDAVVQTVAQRQC